MDLDVGIDLGLDMPVCGVGGGVEEPDETLFIANDGYRGIVTAGKAEGNGVALTRVRSTVVNVMTVAVVGSSKCSVIVGGKAKILFARMGGKSMFPVEELSLEAAIAKLANRLWLIAFKDL